MRAPQTSGRTTSGDRAGVILRRFGLMIYGPTALFAMGQGAVVPLLPVIAAGLGADITVAAVVAGALVIGQLVGNLPAGWTVSRIGERYAMALGGLGSLIGAVGVMLSTSVAALAASVFLAGFFGASFGIARHSFMTLRIPLSFRARALSLQGGTFRLGMFLGPFVSAGLLQLSGEVRASVWFFIACLAGGIVLILVGPDPEARLRAEAQRTQPQDAPPRRGVFRTMRDDRAVLLRLGVAAASLSAARAARVALLPLWGVSVGLDAPAIALVVGVSGAADFALFYASGQIMDRFGRLWAALPAMLLLSGGFMALALTSSLPGRETWYAVMAVVLGTGNALSSGTLLTLGSDVAPSADPGPFLGAWRTLTDAGGASAPLMIAAVTAVSSLPLAAGLMGVLALVGATAFVRWIPRYVPRPRRAVEVGRGAETI